MKRAKKPQKRFVIALDGGICQSDLRGIRKNFVRGNKMRWNADGLSEHVSDVAVKAVSLHD